MQNINLSFPPLSGGQHSGLNDAGIETFQGNNVKYVVRETIQNSLDAANDGRPIRVSFKRRLASTNDYSFLEDLKLTLNRSLEKFKSYPKAKSFFEIGLAKINQTTIDYLEISDYGTIGVSGEDGDQSSFWFGLVKSRGISNKNSDSSGGSYGIGKDAPLAASPFRTVLYSTKTIYDEFAFQGVSRLVTHKCIHQDIDTQGTGYIGDRIDIPGIRFNAVRAFERIPESFRRSDVGLSLYILGFQFNESWEEEFEQNLLSNFWPAILYGKLTVEIGQNTISKDNLFSTFSRYKTKLEKEWAYFMSAYDNVPNKVLFEESLEVLGKCELHVRVNPEHNDVKKVCQARKTGMIIDHYLPRGVRIPYAAFFRCLSEEGNSILKSLEPPSHDKWNPKLAAQDDTKAKKAVSILRKWIRENLKSLIPDNDSNSFNEQSQAQYIPDEDPGLPDSSDGGERDVISIQNVRNPKTYTKEPTIYDAKVSTKKSKKQNGEDEDSEGGGGRGNENEDQGEEGDGKKTGGRVRRTGNEGGNDTDNNKPQRRLNCRPVMLSDESYKLAIRANKNESGDIIILTSGDDGATVPIPLSQAFDASGNELEIHNDEIKNITIEKNQPTFVKIKLKNPGRYVIRPVIK